MQIARVVGTVVATQKNAKLEGAKLLLVQPLDPGGRQAMASVSHSTRCCSTSTGTRVLGLIARNASSSGPRGLARTNSTGDCRCLATATATRGLRFRE